MEQERLIESWLLRKRVEAKIMASAIAELFQAPPEEKISSDELFALMGVAPSRIAEGAEWPPQEE